MYRSYKEQNIDNYALPYTAAKESSEFFAKYKLQINFYRAKKALWNEIQISSSTKEFRKRKQASNFRTDKNCLYAFPKELLPG